ncbi:MAG TPA: 16S rRNA (guanine(527)-N(7))-methyltransferase RsmG [Actinomycetota bacterium]|nr:16S rRNA (guanine(527)-N(7))-methyltransferase RsmG [Actinomycetota bacterium]
MFHVKHEAWARWAAPVPLDPSLLATLHAFEELLLERAIPMGMVAPEDAPRIAERHIGDSLRAAPLLAEAERAIDLGSGAGLPGVPLAIVRPGTGFVLAERRRSRAAFLEVVADRLRLANVEVYAGVAEALTAPFDVCLARAFANAVKAWEVARELLVDGGRLLYWAGEGFDPERDRPAGVRLELFPTSGLANGGPVVIMTRQ